MKIRVAIRVDASQTLGNGHIIRMQALAEELRTRSIEFLFIIKQDSFWKNRLRSLYDIIELSEDSNDTNLVGSIIENDITHLVYDTRGDLCAERLEAIKNRTGIRLCVIDSPEDTRLVADVNIFPPIPQLKVWSWKGFSGEIFSGWEYVLLRKEFMNRPIPGERKDKDLIVLSFGSTDPNFCTERMLQCIANSGKWSKDYTFLVICGPQFDRVEQIKQLSSYKSLNIRICQAPSNIAEIFSKAAFAIIAFGVTAYELAALGIPALYISISKDHTLSASGFEMDKFGLLLGEIETFEADFNGRIDYFLHNSESPLKAIHMNTLIGDWSMIIRAILG